MADRIWTAALLVIGDELLSGRTQDENIVQVARWLNSQGIRLAEVRVVADRQERIIIAVNALRGEYDYLFTTGGIGPTHDDITVDAVAAALGVDVEIHPQARQALEDYYQDRGGMTEARLRLARMPAGGTLVESAKTGAPSFRHGNIFILAGVPYIAGLMLEALSGTLEGGKPIVSRIVGCWVAESEIADLLRDAEAAHVMCKIGSYPFFRKGQIGANFVVRSPSPPAVEACAADLMGRLRALGYDPVDGSI